MNLKFCPDCVQMTNHNGETCQKCKGENKMEHSKEQVEAMEIEVEKIITIDYSYNVDERKIAEFVLSKIDTAKEEEHSKVLECNRLMQENMEAHKKILESESIRLCEAEMKNKNLLIELQSERDRADGLEECVSMFSCKINWKKKHWTCLRMPYDIAKEYLEKYRRK